MSKGFTSCCSDLSIFVLNISYDILIFLLCIDDMLITGSSQVLLDNFIVEIKSEFSMKHTGEITIFWEFKL